MQDPALDKSNSQTFSPNPCDKDIARDLRMTFINVENEGMKDKGRRPIPTKKKTLFFATSSYQKSEVGSLPAYALHRLYEPHRMELVKPISFVGSR